MLIPERSVGYLAEVLVNALQVMQLTLPVRQELCACVTGLHVLTRKISRQMF